MMIMGGWIATIPELPVKTGLGKIVWETRAGGGCARQAPAGAARRPQSEHRVAKRPNHGFADAHQAVAEPEDPELTIEKLTGVFDVLSRT